MKVLILSYPLDKTHNPYVGTLMKSINAQFDDVQWICDLDSIWDDKILKSLDIIHIQWPNQLVLKHTAKDVEELLMKVKKNSIRLVVTCHNYEPHYVKKEDEVKAYKLVYSNADVMLHLGKESCEVMTKSYPQVRHEIIYHHIYNDLFPETYNQDFCRKRIGLKQKHTYVLCFGLFRNDEERDFIASVAEMLKSYNITIVAPSFYRMPERRNKLALIKPLIRLYYEKWKHPNIIMSRKYISDAELPYYYGAADAAVLQRLHILNSGNVPLAFWLGKVVVGPDEGNVGPLLKEFSNPVFDATKPETAVQGILKAIELAKRGLGVKNREQAKRLFSTDVVANHLYNIYSSLL